MCVHTPGCASLKRVGPLKGGEGAQLALTSLRGFHQSPDQPQVLGESHSDLVHPTACVVHQVQEMSAAHL